MYHQHKKTELKVKKIIIIAHGLSDGGAEKVASILASYMSQRGFAVTYVCAYRNVNNINREEYCLDSQICLKYVEVGEKNHLFRFLERNYRIYKIVKEINPDIVISFINYDTLFTSFSKVPIIYSLRNDPSHVKGTKIRTAIFNLEYWRAYKIVFQTNGARNAFGRRIREKSVIIANPLITQSLPVWNGEEHKNIFITACRLNRQKNLHMMVDAFIKVHELHPEYKLEIYGDGELRDEISEHIHKENADDYIIIKGYSTDIHSMMKNSAGFLLSSDYEGLSNAMLEALCIGLPCVCTDSPPGGAREYIEDGINGFLCEIGNAQQMADKISVLIEDTDLAKTFSINSVKYREALNVDGICEKWIKIF